MLMLMCLVLVLVELMSVGWHYLWCYRVQVYPGDSVLLLLLLLVDCLVVVVAVVLAAGVLLWNRTLTLTQLAYCCCHWPWPQCYCCRPPFSSSQPLELHCR
jgi:hypothetical protein